MNTVEIEFANDAFYLAFAQADLAAMEQAWAQNHQITCLHPGWEPLIGRIAVMESWAGILKAADHHPIQCRDTSVHLVDESAYVLCYEVLDGSVMAATNIFTREEGRWVMVHHQAAPTRGRPASDEVAPSLQ